MDTLERDFYEERRRKWRRSAFWRGVFFTLFLIAGIGLAAYSLRDTLPQGRHIAHVSIRDVIYNDPDFNALLEEIRDNDDVRALYLEIDSPGGTTVGSEAVFQLVREIGADRPVVAVMGEVAASGGYIAAIAADHLVARGNTLTGSIGVIMEYPDISELLATIGVQVETVRSSPLKAEPAPYRATSPEGRAAQEALIADSYAWFRTLVSERRGLTGDALDAVADGRVFTGRMALSAGLIDEIGGQKEGLAYLESLDPALADLPLERWALPEPVASPFGIFGVLSGIGDSLAGISRPGGPRLISVLK